MTPELSSAILEDRTIPLFILGYMASGKTTFGRALAKALGREFIDLDFFIEQRFRKSIGRIFEEEGEEGFRRKEAAMLREAGEFYNVVIACGGGTPCFHENLGYMNSRGLTILMDTPRDRIVQRLMLNNSRRPLMAGKTEKEMGEAVDRGLRERDRFYRGALISFSGDLLENRRQIDTSVRSFLDTYTHS